MGFVLVAASDPTGSRKILLSQRKLLLLTLTSIHNRVRPPCSDCCGDGFPDSILSTSSQFLAWSAIAKAVKQFLSWLFESHPTCSHSTPFGLLLSNMTVL